MPSNPDEQIRRAAKEREKAQKLAEQLEAAERKARCELFPQEARQALSRLEAKGWPGAAEVRVVTPKWSLTKVDQKKITVRAGWLVWREERQDAMFGPITTTCRILTNGQLTQNHGNQTSIANFAAFPDHVQKVILANVQQLGR